jgi:hypothetical protein
VLVVVAIAGTPGLLDVDAERPAIEEKKGSVGSTGGDWVQAIPSDGSRALDNLVGVAAQANGAGRQTALVCTGPKTLALAGIVSVSITASLLAKGRGGGPPAGITGRSRGLVTTRWGVGSGRLMATDLLVESV